MKKIIILILVIVLFLMTGCSNKEKVSNSKNIIYNNNKNESFYTIDSVDNNALEEVNNLSSINIGEEINSSDSEIINYVSNLDREISTLTSYNNLNKSAKNKLKQSFITLTDFIFYSGTIGGITFDELSLSTKEKVLDIYSSIDLKIESVWPNYKEKIKTTSKNVYTNILEKTSELKKNIQEKYKEAVGEEVYDNSVQIIDEDIERLKEGTKPTIDFVKEKSKNAYNSIKEKANNWYQNFKESSE